MANGRGSAKKRRYGSSSRDGGGFVALPHVVLDSPAYRALSHPARALLIEVARQFRGDDNGRMLLSRKYLGERGWTSADVIQRAKSELLDAGFLHVTVMGQRPNRAGWYALTWMSLDKLDGFDHGAAATFERSAYLKCLPSTRPPRAVKRTAGSPFDAPSTAHEADAAATSENAVLIPSHGTGGAAIAPSGGTARVRPVPSDGAMPPLSGRSPVPSDGHPLDMPSAAGSFGGTLNGTPERAAPKVRREVVRQYVARITGRRQQCFRVGAQRESA